MVARAEVIVFGCREADLAVLRNAAGPGGPVVLGVESAAEFAQHAIARRPVAVFLGIGTRTLTHLDVIPVIRAVRNDVPVIVVAEEDSLELERRARGESIFYYLVHPVDRSEVEALLKSIMRHARA
jgi:DNA-binding response OmpR family regulator